MTTTVQQTLGRPSAEPVGRPTGIPLSRLIRVELRKLVDTRAGRWLLLGIGLVTVGAVAVYILAADASELTFEHFVKCPSCRSPGCCRCSASWR